MFCFRVRDVNPLAIKPNFSTPRNEYDFLLFHNKILVPSELKSTKAKSFSFDGKNPKIKSHQIQALTRANQYDDVIPGFILNFRSYDNFTCFIHIEDFNHYISVAKGEQESIYQSKVNKSSIPLDICKEIGIEIPNQKKRTRYIYNMKFLFEECIKKFEHD